MADIIYKQQFNYTINAYKMNEIRLNVYVLDHRKAIYKRNITVSFIARLCLSSTYIIVHPTEMIVVIGTIFLV